MGVVGCVSSVVRESRCVGVTIRLVTVRAGSGVGSFGLSGLRKW